MAGPQTPQDLRRKAASHGVPTKSNAVDFILLISPDASVWKVTVDNTGALIRTKQ